MDTYQIANICPMTDEARAYLEDYARTQGLTVVTPPLAGTTSQDVIEALQGFPAAIAGGAEPYTEEVFQALDGTLKAVCRFGAGYDNIDPKAARKHDTAVLIAGGGNSAAVADLTIMLMMALGRQICRLDREMRQGIWRQPQGSVQLAGKTVGIIGFGRIGRILSGYLSGFGCYVMVKDDYVDDAVLEAAGVIRAGMGEIAEKSDYVSVHAPLTPETKEMINRDFLRKMKPTAYLINTSRGGLIHETDLIQALDAGTIAGAALDVFQREPLDGESPLLHMDNVILSPHVAFNSREANLLTAKITIDNLAAYLKTGTCEDIVNL